MSQPGAMSTYVTQGLDFVDRAPLVVEATDTVRATPDEVWAAILDYERWPAWFPRIATCAATSDPPTGIGSTRDVVLKGGGGTFRERFIAWDEPERWSFTVYEGPPLFTSIVERVTLRPLDDDRTEVTYRMALAPRRVLTPILRQARGQLQKVLAGALANLDGELDRRRRLG